MPCLSVLLPIYRANQQYLRESITSLRISTPVDSEILIGLDGPCTKDIGETIGQLQSNKGGAVIKVLSLPKRGLAATLNTLIEKSDSQWIARQDADDICLPDRLKQQIEALECSSDAAFCGTQIIRCDQEMRPFRLQRAYPCTHRTQLVYSCCINNPIAHPSLLLSRQKLGQIRYQEIQGAEDWMLYISLWRDRHKSINLPKPGLLYRVHPGQITAKKRSFAIIDEMKRETVLAIKASGEKSWPYETLRRASNLAGVTRLGLELKRATKRY